MLAAEPPRPRGRGLLTAIGSFAVVVAAILTAAWLVRSQSDIDQPGPLGGPDVLVSTTATSEAAPPPPGDPAATTAPAPTTQPTLGWQLIELPIEQLEGSTYVLGGEDLLVWGGSVDRQSDVRNDGWIVTLAGDLTPVTAAPIEPRVEASGVWTGSEFIVFGGRRIDGSQSPPTFLDGAVLNPETGSWTSIPPAPLEPGTRTAAAWTGSRLVIWVAAPASGAAPEARAGQFAVYDPKGGGWEVLPAPDVTLADATLFATERRLTVIGGPNMGSQMFAQDYLVAAAFDFETERWTARYEFAYTLQASATRTGDGTFLAVTAEGQVGDFDGFRWTSRGSVLPSIAYPIKVTAGGGETYILSDETYRMVDGEQVETIPWLPAGPVGLCWCLRRLRPWNARGP